MQEINMKSIICCLPFFCCFFQSGFRKRASWCRFKL